MRVGQMLEGGGGSADPPPALLFPPAFTCLLLFFLLLFATMPHGSRGIDCFKCVSVNGDNPACEDPFHNNYTNDMLQTPCLAGRKDRNGLFPATACIKLAGYYESGKSIVVRSCALDSGTLTTDTEIIRMSHCGGIYLDGKYVKGCLQSCDDYEGCNSSPPGPSSSSSSPYLVLLLLLSHFLLHHHRSS